MICELHMRQPHWCLGRQYVISPGNKSEQIMKSASSQTAVHSLPIISPIISIKRVKVFKDRIPYKIENGPVVLKYRHKDQS